MSKLMLLMLCASLITGCTSFHTTLVDRFENDSLAPDRCQRRCLTGVPVRLKVPTHVRVSIVETQALVTGTSADQATTTARLVSFTPRHLNVSCDLDYTPKVFLVDFRRPMAGTLDLTGAANAGGITFGANQYFTTIQASVQERTIRDVTGVINTFPNTASATSSAAGQQTSAVGNAPMTPPNVELRQSVVAFERFDISEPGWEERMHAFVDSYLGETSGFEALGKAQGMLSEQPGVSASLRPAAKERRISARVTPAAPGKRY